MQYADSFDEETLLNELFTHLNDCYDCLCFLFSLSDMQTKETVTSIYFQALQES